MYYYIYILYSEASDLFYVGYTKNVTVRFQQHNETSRDSFTAKHRPWILKAIFQVGKNEAQAIALEKFIKNQKSRKLIERLIDPDFLPTGKLAQLVRVPHVRD
ncbi:MAG TPA: GIY-YIG nuclease family protein [Chitinophagaceae bacterium]|nr:GIY-YIG nuclease family protein [Chitinophagaceae bacterium]HNF70992.1 GIY-YIG nuclease family protein [Chitinophagaceae bacterium]HNF70993.1 GIY-YIG nuclease family protein [Chitinophagaceae bacterium]